MTPQPRTFLPLVGLLAASAIGPSAPPAPPEQLPQASAPASGGSRISPTAIHRAWMREVLDLDPLGAIERYKEIAAHDDPGNLSRWVAAARLFELRRLGIVDTLPIDLANVPLQLRPRFADAQPRLDSEKLLLRITGDPEQVLKEISTAEGELPDLRGLVPDAASWFVESSSGLSREDRMRQNYANNTLPPFTDRVFARWILQDEVRDNRKQADEKRSIYFILWQPPKRGADVQVELARFRRNIETLLAEREWNGRYRGWHRRLRQKVEELANEDPAAAMDLVRRLPQYAERLLAPIPEEDR